jgi:ATPase family associated with various cellular activities (AAA)
MSDINNSLAPIVDGIDSGIAVFMLSGRPLKDLAVCPRNTNKIRPLLAILQDKLKEVYGFALLTYDRAAGFDFDSAVGDNTRDRQTIETLFQAHNALEIPQDEYEIPHVMRAIDEMCRLNTGGLKWGDGKPMRLFFLLDFAAHLIPCFGGAAPTENQMVALELAAKMGQSLAFRQSGNVVAFQAQDPGKIDALVRSLYHPIHFPQPSETEKLHFLRTAINNLYHQARFEDGLSLEQVAFILSNTPNSSTEKLLRASHRRERPIPTKELTEQKAKDIEDYSEGSLTVLDTSKISANAQLQGINSLHPQSTLEKLARYLREGNPNMPMNVMLVGSPGTGKTQMAVRTARQAGVCAFQMNSPKRSFVGETPRVAALQQRIIGESTPNLVFADEVNGLIQPQSGMNLDSGASQAVTSAILTGLSDESRRGKSLFIATTNCPDQLGGAMLSRFILIPVIQPLEQDYPAIIIATAQKVDCNLAELDQGDPDIVAAAKIFYKIGANARHIRSSLSNALLAHNKLDPQAILSAAKDCIISGDRDSAIYSDLLAISVCTSKRFFPWADCLATYPFPPHLEGLIDRQTGDIDRDELQKRIAQLKPHANL